VSVFAVSMVVLILFYLLIGVWLEGVISAVQKRKIDACFPVLIYSATPFALALVDSPAWAPEVAEIYGVSAYGVATTYYSLVVLALRGGVAFLVDVAAATSVFTRGPKG